MPEYFTSFGDFEDKTPETNGTMEPVCRDWTLRYYPTRGVRMGKAHSGGGDSLTEDAVFPEPSEGFDHRLAWLSSGTYIHLLLIRSNKAIQL